MIKTSFPSPSIRDKIKKFELLASPDTSSVSTKSHQFWYYKDGIRSPKYVSKHDSKAYGSNGTRSTNPSLKEEFKGAAQSLRNMSPSLNCIRNQSPGPLSAHIGIRTNVSLTASPSKLDHCLKCPSSTCLVSHAKFVTSLRDSTFPTCGLATNDLLESNLIVPQSSKIRTTTNTSTATKIESIIMKRDEDILLVSNFVDHSIDESSPNTKPKDYVEDFVLNNFAKLKEENYRKFLLLSSLQQSLTELELEESETISQIRLEMCLLEGDYEIQRESLQQSISHLHMLEERMCVLSEDLSNIWNLIGSSNSSGIQNENNCSNYAGYNSSIFVGQKRKISETEVKIIEDLEFNKMEEIAKQETEMEQLVRDIETTKEVVRFLGSNLEQINIEMSKYSASVDVETEKISVRRQKIENNIKSENIKKRKIELQLSKISSEIFGTSFEENISIDKQDPIRDYDGKHFDDEKIRVSQNGLQLLMNDKALDSINSGYLQLDQVKSPNATFQCPKLKYVDQKSISISSVINKDNSLDSGENDFISTESECEMFDKEVLNPSLFQDESFNNTSSPQKEWGPNIAAGLSNAVVPKRDKARIKQERPLTRYLPFFNSDFDLVAHIMTAGHAQCGDVKLDMFTCQGHLRKLTSSKSAIIKTWKKRWFLFDRVSRRLSYFADKNQRKLKGSINFMSIQDVYIHRRPNKASVETRSFCVKTTDREIYLIASTVESMRIWMDVIFTGAEGYLQFQTY